MTGPGREPRLGSDERRRRARVVHPYVWTGIAAVIAVALVAAALLFAR